GVRDERLARSGGVEVVREPEVVEDLLDAVPVALHDRELQVADVEALAAEVHPVDAVVLELGDDLVVPFHDVERVRASRQVVELEAAGLVALRLVAEVLDAVAAL